METVYIIMSYTGTRVSKFFNFFTGATYTHASICLDSSFEKFYSFARRNIKLPIIGGIVEEYPNEGIFGMYDTDCLVYRLSVTKEQKEAIKEEIEHMLRHPHVYTYNLVGCPFILFGIPLRRKHHFTCTQFTAYILEHNGVKALPVSYALAKPQDFLGCGELVYKGKLKNLHSEGTPTNS